MAVSATRKLGGDQKCIPLKDIRLNIFRMYPKETLGTSEETIDAILNYHCINMRARFPDPLNQRKNADWMTSPLFYRCERGMYRLLTQDEVVVFKEVLNEGHDIVYRDEYTMNSLRSVFKKIRIEKI